MASGLVPKTNITVFIILSRFSLDTAIVHDFPENCKGCHQNVHKTQQGGCPMTAAL